MNAGTVFAFDGISIYPAGRLNAAITAAIAFPRPLYTALRQIAACLRRGRSRRCR